MAYWLLKTEPDEYSWDDQLKRGAKGEAWTGVRNFTARRYLKEMKKGDKFFFYHTGDEKQVVGMGRRYDHRRQATAETRHARKHKGGAEAQGHGARQICTSVGATGHRCGVETRL